MSGFGKSLKGTFSQAEGLNCIHENIYVIKVKASRILWDRKLARVRFTPLIYYPVSWVMSTWVNFHLHLSACVVVFFFTQLLPFCCSWYFRLGDHFQQEMVQQYFYTGVEVTQKRLTVAPVSAGPCGLSAVGVKATSYPWLTWRTPTVTTVSSEKQLCGYA